jgi:transcriptional regulator with XRE-family HTH domain
MPNRSSSIGDAAWLATHIARETGRELRIGRLTSGLTQQQVAARVGRSTAHISRVERGQVPSVRLRDVVRIGAVVGLRPSIRLYPTARRPLDGPQLALIAGLRARIHGGWSVQVEVPMPGAHDLRAADAVLEMGGIRIAVEAITRLADVQAQVRAARLKQRDLHADRLLVVVAGTSANRRLLRSFDPAATLPVRTRQSVEALAAAKDPGTDAIVVL